MSDVYEVSPQGFTLDVSISRQTKERKKNVVTRSLDQPVIKRQKTQTFKNDKANEQLSQNLKFNGIKVQDFTNDSHHDEHDLIDSSSNKIRNSRMVKNGISNLDKLNVVNSRNLEATPEKLIQQYSTSPSSAHC